MISAHPALTRSCLSVSILFSDLLQSNLFFYSTKKSLLYIFKLNSNLNDLLKVYYSI